MTAKIPAPERAEVRNLLLRWQRGELTFYQAVEEAEAIEDRVFADVDVIEYPPNDPGEIPTEVLGMLSMGYVQPLFPEDIPYLVECLDAPAGREDEYLQRLGNYFDGLDQKERYERALKIYAQDSAG